MWLSPGALGPRGLAPTTIDFIGKNGSGTTVSVGDLQILDWKLADATDYNTGSETGAFYTLTTPVNTNSYLSYAVGAILIGDTKGTGTSVADGEEGLWRLIGKVKDALVTDRSDDGAAATAGVVAGTWVAMGTTTTRMVTSDDTSDTNLASGPKIIGFTLEDIAAGGTIDAEVSVDIMFNGYGLGKLQQT